MTEISGAAPKNPKPMTAAWPNKDGIEAAPLTPASSETAEQFQKLMERHEIGWLTWREDDARKMLDAISRLEKERDDAIDLRDAAISGNYDCSAELSEAKKHMNDLIAAALHAPISHWSWSQLSREIKNARVFLNTPSAMLEVQRDRDAT